MIFALRAKLSNLVIPAECADSRAAELDNIAAWAAKNNLQLNKLKTREVVFHDSRRRHGVQSPPLLPDVNRDTTLEVLGVTFSSNLSASDHIRRVLSDSAHCAVAVYALHALTMV